MPGDRYAEIARRFIEELETSSLAANESVEQFYDGLRDVIEALRDRLGCAISELGEQAARELDDDV